MRISKLKLANWRNFKEVSVSLPHRVFIVGQNASGKSNLLDAIRFLRDLVKLGGGLQEAVKSRDGVSKIRCLAARSYSDIEIEIEISDDNDTPIWLYSLSFTQTGGGVFDLRAKLRSEKVTDLRTNKILIQRPNKEDEKDEVLLEYTFLEQASANQKFREISDFLSGIEYLHIIPQLLRDPQSFLKSSKKEDFFGRDFLEKINKTNKSKQKAYLKRIEAALRLTLPNLENLAFEKDEMGVPHFEASFKHWRGTAAKQKENQFSDGTLRFIGLFWALQDGSKPILLEEPELSLHSGIVSRLPEIIWKLQKKKSVTRQVILTTHSIDLLSSKSIRGDEVLLLLPDKEGTQVIPAVNKPDIKLLLDSGLSVGEIVIPKTAPQNLQQLTLGF